MSHNSYKRRRHGKSGETKQLIPISADTVYTSTRRTQKVRSSEFASDATTTTTSADLWTFLWTLLAFLALAGLSVLIWDVVWAHENVARLDSKDMILMSNVSSLEQDLQQETTERLEKDMILMQNVTDLANQIADSNTTELSMRIDAEEAARIAKDMELMQNVTSLNQMLGMLDNETMFEFMVKMQNISDLVDAIDAEEAARIDKDMILMQNVTDLANQIADSNTTELSMRIDAEEAARIAKDMELMQNVTDLDAAIQAEEMARMMKDMELMQNITDVSTQSIFTINDFGGSGNNFNVTATGSIQVTVGMGTMDFVGDVVQLDNAGDLDLVFDGAGPTLSIKGLEQGVGINITDTGTNLAIANTGVLTVESLVAVGGNIDFSGTGGIGIATGPGANEVSVDGSVLETAINNLDMTVSGQSSDISDLQAKDMILMDQINALNTSGQMVIEALNGTTISVNMTLMDLIADVMMLQSQVSALEDALANATAEVIPTGAMLPYGGTPGMVPMGYLLCDGAMYPDATWPDLAVAIGTAYCGGGCPVGMFRVPDMRGNVAVGESGGDPNFGTRGQTSGSASVTLTTGQMPMHTHTAASDGSHTHGGTANSGGNHNHGGGTSSANVDIQINDAGSTANGVGRRSGAGIPTNGFIVNTHAHAISFSGSHTHSLTVNAGGSHSHSISSAGSSEAHPNVQPSLTLGGYIIKT